MKKHLKWLIPTICVALAVSAGAGYFFWRNTRIPTEIIYMEAGDTDVNLSDPREVVGVSQYVFVGYIQDTFDYFTQKSGHDFPAVIDYYDREFTECKIKVIANIKGELQTGSVFSFYKVGGITENRRYILLDHSDIMPEVGKYYIFTGYAHPDGTVTGGGTNGTIELEAGIDESNLTQSEIYKKYVDAYENQILPEFYDKDYYASADINFGDGSYNAEVYYTKNKNGLKDKEYYNAVKSGNPKIE